MTKTEFQREERYVVFKVSDLGNSLKGDEIRRLAREYAEQRRLKGKEPLECVVVEKDWPEYEPTWKAIEARVTGAQSVPEESAIQTAARVMNIELIRERDELRAKIEAAENDAAHQKALAASALRVAEGWERKCGELRAEVIYWKEQKEPGAAGWRALARILQAKIDAMEKQEPAGYGVRYVEPANGEEDWDSIWMHRVFAEDHIKDFTQAYVDIGEPVGAITVVPLYALPGAQTQGEEE